MQNENMRAFKSSEVCGFLRANPRPGMRSNVVLSEGQEMVAKAYVHYRKNGEDDLMKSLNHEY